MSEKKGKCEIKCKKIKYNEPLTWYVLAFSQHKNPNSRINTFKKIFRITKKLSGFILFIHTNAASKLNNNPNKPKV